MNDVMSPTSRLCANSLLMGVGIAAFLSSAFSANQVPTECSAVQSDGNLNYRYNMLGLDFTRGASYSAHSQAYTSTGTARLETAVSAVYQDLVAEQESLGEEFTTSLSSRLWDLYEV